MCLIMRRDAGGFDEKPKIGFAVGEIMKAFNAQCLYCEMYTRQKRPGTNYGEEYVSYQDVMGRGRHGLSGGIGIRHIMWNAVI
jgi:hypothetical protein